MRNQLEEIEAEYQQLKVLSDEVDAELKKCLYAMKNQKLSDDRFTKLYEESMEHSKRYHELLKQRKELVDRKEKLID